MTMVEIDASREVGEVGAGIGPRRLGRRASGGMWGRRELIGQMMWREVVGRYRGTALGIVWSLINPLLMLGVYTFAFGFVFRVVPREGGAGGIGDFALFVFAGMAVFGVVSETLNRAVVCVVQNVNYVKKVVFPLEIFAFVQVGGALVQAGICGVVLVLANWVLHGASGGAWMIFIAPLAMVPLVLMMLGFWWVLAAAGVFLRDLAQMVGIGTMALIYVSPVFYSVETVGARSRMLGALIRLNPVTVPVENFRGAILGRDFGGGFAPWTWTVGHAAASVAIAWAGYIFFRRMKRGFADVV